MSKTKVVYVVSDIDKSLAFEWIATEINDQAFEIHFLLLNPGPSELERFLQSKGIPVRTIICSSKKDWAKAFRELLKYFKGYKPDVVHCHLFQANILGLIAAKFARVPKRLYTRHHSDYHFRYFPKGVKWDKLCNRLATKIIAPSGVVEKVLVEMEHVPPQKVVIIHHGFDLAYFKEVAPEQLIASRTKYNPSERTPVIGVISRFTELKGIQYIIPAFRRLLEMYPEALLLMFNAKGDYEKELTALLNDLPEHTYLPVLFEQNLAAVYPLFDVFVQVSTDTNIEAFGQTYVEALAAGVPSVFTLAGIASDFVKDHQNALVVPYKDADAIYEALVEILGDPMLRASLKQHGAQAVAHLFELNKMIKALEEIYKS